MKNIVMLLILLNFIAVLGILRPRMIIHNRYHMKNHWKKVERMVDGDSSRNPYLGVSWLEENGDIVIASSSAIEYALREGCSRGTDTRTLSTNVKTFLQRGEYF